MKSFFRGPSLCLVSIFILGVLTAHAANNGGASSHTVSVNHTLNHVRLSNDYLELVFDRENHTIVCLAADHNGKRHFGKNLLASGGIRFNDGGPANDKATRAEIKVFERTPRVVKIRLSWPSISQHPRVERQLLSELVLVLRAADRGVHFHAVFPVPNENAAMPSIRVALHQWFLLGLFDRGVVQYVAGQNQMFPSLDPLRLFYTLDRENGSVAIQPEDSRDIYETVLLSGNGLTSGIELRTGAAQRKTDQWLASSAPNATTSNSAIANTIPSSSTADSAIQSTAPKSAHKLTINFCIYANDLAFPIHHPENMIVAGDSDSEKARHDSEAYLTAIYGSAVGVLGSYAEAGSAYPTLATPDRPYGDSFNFFDPDAWSTVTTLSYSGDPLLQKEARRILERTGNAMRTDGQMPHHFEAGAPTCLSIAKSSQTGPNIFWVIAASEYAAGSGDEAWLRAHYAHLKSATDWVLEKYDPAHRLLRADGPLFIDVFRRSGYTLDTNVATLYLLDRMAEVADFCGDVKSAEKYRIRRHDLYLGIRDELWDTNSNDHFITQKNLDGTVRDMIDYDGNFAALAFDVPDQANAKRLLQRLDSGSHTHPDMRGTWVSERRYTKDDCYGENDGDSDVTMARIWWLDMAARVRLNDRANFDTLLEAIESDLLRNVWMPERFDSDGRPAHNDYYHEYPDILTMVLREMRYGVHIGMREVTIRPFGISNFNLRLGGLRVSYSPDAVSIAVPGSTTRDFVVGGLHPGLSYSLSTGERLAADATGTLRFRAHAGELIHVRRINQHK